MKTLNDFKNEYKDLEKFEMLAAFGGLAADPKPTITDIADSNWNCGDVMTCFDTAADGRVCITKNLPDKGQ